jgi:hypothetical protein
VGALATAPGDGISCWAYPYTAEQGYSNPLSMKHFHEVLAGNAHGCSLKLRIGEVRRLPHGATKDSIDLYRIIDLGLSREDRNHLVNRGIRNIDDNSAIPAYSLVTSSSHVNNMIC